MVSTYTISNRDEFVEKIRAASQIRQMETAKDAKRKLNKDRKRINELDTIIKKLYESFAIGRLSEERFDSLLVEYEAEQKSLLVSAQDTEQRLSSFKEDTARVEQFLALAKKYTDFSELTTPMINEFIDKIIVHAPEKVDGDRMQEVEIHLKFIGRFALPALELTSEEIAEQERLRKESLRSRERYRRIKAGERSFTDRWQQKREAEKLSVKIVVRHLLQQGKMSNTAATLAGWRQIGKDNSNVEKARNKNAKRRLVRAIS